MYLITVPPPVLVKNIMNPADPGKLHTLEDAVKVAVHDERFGKDIKSLRSAQQILRAFENCQTGGIIKVHPNDYPLLKEAVETPKNGYQSGFAVQIISLLDAILEAKKEEPVPAN